MTGYFLLDPDYKDFDFPDRHKLKFQTVYGEKSTSIIAVVSMLIGCGAFLLLIFAAIARDFQERNIAHTSGTVIQGCGSLSSWYIYSFKAKDQSGILRQFTSGTYADKKNMPCREVGDSVQVEYLRDDPDSSHEFTGESSSHTSIYVYVFVLIFDFYGLYLAIRGIRAVRKARPQYDRLKHGSIFIRGQISHMAEVNNWLRPRVYVIEVEYEFQHDGQRMQGIQCKRRNDLQSKPLPKIGTPVRILYADENTYVML